MKRVNLSFSVRAESDEDAEKFGRNAADHLAETFNDDDSLGRITVSLKKFETHQAEAYAHTKKRKAKK